MERRYVLWGVIALMLVASLFLTFVAGGVSADSVQAAASAAASAGSYSGMVGGC